jgi:hypothetical protein
MSTLARNRSCRHDRLFSLAHARYVPASTSSSLALESPTNLAKSYSPLLGPLASYFEILVRGGAEATEAIKRLRDYRVVKPAMDKIEQQKCKLVELYQNFGGNVDKLYKYVIGNQPPGMISEEAQQKLKQAMLAQIQRCCIEMIRRECPKSN